MKSHSEGRINIIPVYQATRLPALPVFPSSRLSRHIIPMPRLSAILSDIQFWIPSPFWSLVP
jgi:hypothetical protein